MIERYSLPAMAALWTDDAVLARWVLIESRVAAAQAARGLVPVAAAEAIAATPPPSVADVAAAERDRDHEILSFLAAWTAPMHVDVARWVHRGLTSYDVVDTGLGVALRDSLDLVIDAAVALADELARKADEQWGIVAVGRTHGVHAEPISFGHRLASYAFAIRRSVTRLQAARTAVAVGTLSGAVGTYSTTSPDVEFEVLTGLGLTAEPAPTQVVARDRHAEALCALAVLGACIEQVALEFRLLQQTEIGELEEGRTALYQGSSAMPHKRNPTTSERLCGLARLLRANASAALEDVALWHERDLAHSSVERVVLPDSMLLAHYQAVSARDLVAGARIDTARVQANLQASAGRIASSRVYGLLVESGVDREKAYRVVQDSAARSLATGEEFADVLARAEVPVDADRLHPASFLMAESVVRDRLHKAWNGAGTVRTRPADEPEDHFGESGSDG